MSKKKIIRMITVGLLIPVCFALIFVTNETQNATGSGHTKEEQENHENQNVLDTVVEKVPEKVELKDKTKSEDSKWLAAGMVIAISLQYMDFEIEEIYIPSENEKEACIIFTSEGERKAIYAEPLDGERKESGTRDFYSKDLGFATFDEVNAEAVDVTDMTRIELEELRDLISQSLLISVYEH